MRPIMYTDRELSHAFVTDSRAHPKQPTPGASLSPTMIECKQVSVFGDQEHCWKTLQVKLPYVYMHLLGATRS